METLFDSHAHYYDSRFTNEGDVDALLTSLFAGEVGGIVNVGTDPENAKTVIAQAAKYPFMYAAVGIHPSDGQYLPDPKSALLEIEALIADRDVRRLKKIVALGEIGLDYHYEDTDKEKQAVLFEEQLKMAERHQIPVIIHDREAHGDVFDAVLRHPAVTGVFHSFSGSAEMAKDLCRLGWYVSFSGVATFKNATKVREAIAAVPTDRLLVETDCPYLAPVPHRGKTNHSGYMRYTAEAMAQVKGIPYGEMVAITHQNAKRLFKI